jgi:hypothetical protein
VIGFVAVAALASVADSDMCVRNSSGRDVVVRVEESESDVRWPVAWLVVAKGERHCLDWHERDYRGSFDIFVYPYARGTEIGRVPTNDGAFCNESKRPLRFVVYDKDGKLRCRETVESEL